MVSVVFSSSPPALVPVRNMFQSMSRILYVLRLIVDVPLQLLRLLVILYEDIGELIVVLVLLDRQLTPILHVSKVHEVVLQCPGIIIDS